MKYRFLLFALAAGGPLYAQPAEPPATPTSEAESAEGNEGEATAPPSSEPQPESEEAAAAPAPTAEESQPTPADTATAAATVESRPPPVQPELAEPEAPSSPPAGGSNESSSDTDSGVRIEDMKTPTAPAFALIGVVPSEVESPRTPKDVALALYNALEEGRLQRNVALEIAPYWLVSHPELTYEEYTNAPWERQFFHNLTLSAATAEVEPPADDPTALETMDVGFGIRTHVFWAPSASTALEDAERHLAELQEMAIDVELWKQQGCSDPPQTDLCKGLWENVKKARVSEADLRAAAERIDEARALLPGFGLSLAGAIAYNSPAAEINLGGMTKRAGWLTASYRTAPLDVAVVGRYTNVTPGLSYWDAGARLGLIRPRYGAYLEAVGRWFQGDDDRTPVKSTGRMTGTLEFALNDAIFLSATFGKALDDETGEGGTVSLLGVNFQASRERKLTGLPERL